MYNSWVEISKSAILHNLSQYHRIVGRRVEIMSIVKSNAYGHGMVDVSKVKGVKAGDEVILLGKKNPAEDMAEKIGTIN